MRCWGGRRGDQTGQAWQLQSDTVDMNAGSSSSPSECSWQVHIYVCLDVGAFVLIDELLFSSPAPAVLPVTWCCVDLLLVSRKWPRLPVCSPQGDKGLLWVYCTDQRGQGTPCAHAGENFRFSFVVSREEENRSSVPNVLTSCFLDYICLLMMKLTWAVFTTGYALKSKISKWDFHSNATWEPFKNLSVTFSFAYCEKHFNNLKNLMVCKGSSWNHRHQ